MDFTLSATQSLVLVIIGWIAKNIVDHFTKSWIDKLMKSDIKNTVKTVVLKFISQALIPLMNLAFLIAIFWAAGRRFPKSIALTGADVPDILALSGFLSVCIFSLLQNIETIRKNQANLLAPPTLE